jgi:hypothetical protein
VARVLTRYRDCGWGTAASTAFCFVFWRKVGRAVEDNPDFSFQNLLSHSLENIIKCGSPNRPIRIFLFYVFCVDTARHFLAEMLGRGIQGEMEMREITL